MSEKSMLGSGNVNNGMMNNLTEPTNSSSNTNQASSDSNQLDRGICYGVIGLFALLDNVLLCVVFLRNRQMLKKAYNIIILFLAVVDTLTGALMIVLATNFLLYLVRGESESMLHVKITVLTFGKMSVLLVLCLALDRWYAIVKPIRYRYSFTTRRVFLYVAVIVTITGFCNIPSALFRSKAHETYFEITEVIVMVLIPILHTWFIFIHIWIHSKTSPAMQNTAGGKIKSKLLRMCAITAILLSICWSPLQIKRLIDLIQMREAPFSTQLVMLAMVNSCVNPWVYYFTNQKYKKEIQKLLPCIAIKRTSKASSSDKFWGRRSAENVARENTKTGIFILSVRNLDELTMPA